MKEPETWTAKVKCGGELAVLATKRRVYFEVNVDEYAWAHLEPAEARSFAAALLAAADRAESKS